jgi:hypothetical protein
MTTVPYAWMGALNSSQPLLMGHREVRQALRDEVGLMARLSGGSAWRIPAGTLIAFLLLISGCGSPNPEDGGFTAGLRAEGRGETNPFDGYTLFQPLRSRSVYLVDLNGGLAHRWQTRYLPGQSVYMLENGHLLRAARPGGYRGPFKAGGGGGVVQEIAWDGTVLWEFRFADENRRAHHDIAPLPNGNVLIIAWELKTADEALAAGLDSQRLGDGSIWPDFVVEVQPVRPKGGSIVWEWHAWDHLVQEHSPALTNFGDVSEHPELIDINAVTAHRQRVQQANPERIEWLQALGYVDSSVGAGGLPSIEGDLLHTNAIDYNWELDQILLTVRHFNEIWVIDHSTTTEEAAGHAGGRGGRGGDLLYRWGNPEVHGAGTASNQRLFAHHDARWIPHGYPGAGNILVFNNGRGRPGENYSTVDEIVPPVDSDGRYRLQPGRPAEPEDPDWSYSALDPADMYSSHVAGAHRLPNGNTLIAVGIGGRILEVGADNTVVWEYVNPYREDERPSARRKKPKPDAGPALGSIYRATRLPRDHPGLAQLKNP